MRKFVFKSMIVVFAVLSISCTSASKVKETYSKYKDNGKYGLIDQKKNVVLKAEFEEIKYNEVYLCTSKGQKNCIYDNKLNLLYEMDPEAYKIKFVSPNLFYYMLGTKTDTTTYLLNLQTKESYYSPAHFAEENSLSSEPWIAHVSGFFSQDMQVKTTGYYHTYPYRNNRAVILTKDWETEIIDENFDCIVRNIMFVADYYSEGLIPVSFEGEYTESGEWTNGKNCYIDIDGNIVYECDFKFDGINRGSIKDLQTIGIIGSFHEGMAVVRKLDETWVILNRDFTHFYLPEDCLPASYAYTNGLLLVTKEVNGKAMYGYVDKTCKMVVPCEYSYAEPFDGKYAIVRKDGIDGVIDKKGKFTAVTDFMYK